MSHCDCGCVNEKKKVSNGNCRWSEVIFSAKKAQDDLESESKSPAPQVVPRLTGRQEALKLPDPLPDDTPSPLKPPVYLPPGFCTECYVPVPDDPDPETLFIYLHALRYTTEQLGTWETPMPRWASADWDGDWRGWEEGAILPNALEEDRRKREIETAKKADSVLSNNLGDEALTPVALAGGSVQGR